MPAIDRLLNQLPDGVTVKRRLPPGSLRSQRHSITRQSMSHASSDVNQDSEARIVLDDTLAGSDTAAGPSSDRHGTGPGSSSIGSQLASVHGASQSHLQLASVNIAAHPIFEPSYEFGDFEIENGSTIPFPGSGVVDSYYGQLSPGAFLRSLQYPGMFVTFKSERLFNSDTTCCSDLAAHVSR